MLLQGSQRGGAKNLALHLLKDENDYVDVHELRGFVSDDLVDAFKEMQALSKGTRAKQFMFSCSFNPPQDEEVSTEVFEKAFDRVEQKLKLDGQPRAIVFHCKDGRRHAHVVWSRVDVESMTAIQLSFSKLKLKDVSRELYLENGWQLPAGYANSKERSPLNYNLAQWQQAQRVKKDPKAIKEAFTECWSISGGQKSFAAALKLRGYLLAKGDRRGAVALDEMGEVYSVAKWSGVKAKAVREKLGDLEALPSVAEARSAYAAAMASHLQALKQQKSAAISAQLSRLAVEKEMIVASHRLNQRSLRADIERQREMRLQNHAAQFRKGLAGLFDRVTGRTHTLVQRFQESEYQHSKADQSKLDQVIFDQLSERRKIERRVEQLKQLAVTRAAQLDQDIEQYHELLTGSRDKFDRASQKNHFSRDGPDLEL